MDRGFVIGAAAFAITASLIAIPSFAQADGRAAMNQPMTRAEVEARVAQGFAAADTDGNGQITREEAEAHRAEMGERMRGHMFDRLDADGNGEVTTAERDAARQSRRERMAERRAQAWNSADADNSGGLSAEEFAALGEHGRERLDARGEARDDRGRRGHRGMRHRGNMFERSDANGDGVVTLAEAAARPLEMFDRADADNDGTVTPEERRAAWQAHRAERRQNRGS